MGACLVGLHALNTPISRNIVQKSSATAKPLKASLVSFKEHVYSLPSRLLIPRLHIDASIVPMGLTASGNMEAPKTNTDTGWYSSGTRPGNVGSAVIDGHLGLQDDAVFGKLSSLVAGDKLSVIDNQGSTALFVVRKALAYEKDSNASDIFSSKNGAHLNLITCNGDWDASQTTFAKRLIIFSDKTSTTK